MTHPVDHSADEPKLWQLFVAFVDAGLLGRFEEAFSLIDEPYIGVGLGEQGVIKSREEAAAVLRGGYRADSKATVTYDVSHFLVNFLSDDAAILTAQIDITTTPENGEPQYSGLMQTIGARRKDDRWLIGFTHASTTILTLESVEAYPVRFMDHTLSLLKAGLQAETMLFAEVNLTKNTVMRLECKVQEWSKDFAPHTFEEVVQRGLYAEASDAVAQEYHAFWNRLRLLGLFAEGVTQDHFDYRMSTEKGFVWLRSAVEMIRQSYTGDVLAVISFTNQDAQRQELEQYTHKAYHDALTGVLNRDGFESRAADLLRNYDPQSYTALFMIDLDDFKQINDRLGHQVGDSVLQEVATVLRDTFHGVGTVGRMGGDEFMALIRGNVSFAEIEEKAELLLNAMKLSMGGSKQIPVSVSIGVAYGRARTTFENLYRIADIALYTAKRTGKCRYHLINTDTSAEHSYCAANLLSLQTLLDYSDDKAVSLGKTPYEALVENIPGGVVVMELTPFEITLTHCNDWFNRLVGYSEAEVMALQTANPFAFAHPDDLPMVTSMAQQIRDGLDSFNVVYRVRHKDGSYRHIATAASTTERRQDSVIMYGIDTDVEEVVQLKQEVESTHNKLAALVSALPSGLVLILLGDRVALRHGNHWTARYLGYTPEELHAIEKTDALALVHPDDLAAVSAAIARMYAGAPNVHVSYRLMRKDGTYRQVRINASFAERGLSENNTPLTTYYGVLSDMEEIISASPDKSLKP